MGFIEKPINYPSHFFDAGNGADPFKLIITLALEIDPEIDTELLRKIHYDVVDIFSGRNPAFRRNSMLYHTLRHTMMVALAAMRFLHGLHIKGTIQIDQQTLVEGMLCAYFHDMGMLLKSNDPIRNASLYIPVHERRSAHFLSEYVALNHLDPAFAANAEIIIAYTWLNKNPKTFPPHSTRVKILGQLVGASDLLAQMGDRYYLESLPLLFTELKRGELNTHKDVMELMVHTIFFYNDVVLARFTKAYFEVFDAMRIHFKHYDNIDKNLYLEAINKNLQYLEKILEICPDIDCVLKYLRRKAPAI